MGFLDKISGKKESSSKDPKKVWEDFFKAAMKNEWPKAQQLIEALKQLEPDNPQVFMKCGDVLQRTGDKDGAVAAYHDAAARHYESMEGPKALAIYKIILRLSPEDEDAIRATEHIMQELGMVEATQASMAKAAAEAAEEGSYDEGGIDIQDQGSGYEQAAEEAPAEEAPAASAQAAPSAPPPAAPKAAAPAASKPKSILEAFARHPVLSALTTNQIMELPKTAKLLSFQDKQPVVKEDEAGDCMYIIKKGNALVTTNMLGKTFVLAKLTMLDVFGEQGLLTGSPRSATVTSIGPLQVLEISKPLFQQMVEKNPRLLEKLVETSQSRSQSTLNKVKGS